MARTKLKARTSILARRSAPVAGLRPGQKTIQVNRRTNGPERGGPGDKDGRAGQAFKSKLLLPIISWGGPGFLGRREAPRRVKQSFHEPAPATTRSGIYISVPFCRSKCTYCNFASGVYPASEHDRYVERVTEDLAGAGLGPRNGVELPRSVDTVYLGGGTPSLLAPALMRRLFAAMRTEFDRRGGCGNYSGVRAGTNCRRDPGGDGRSGREPREPGGAVVYRSEAHASGRLHNRGWSRRICGGCGRRGSRT